MNLSDTIEARTAFVKMIKEENFYSDLSKQSLKAHWSGKARGFSNHMVQSRWEDFLAGWRAAKEPNEHWRPMRINSRCADDIVG